MILDNNMNGFIQFKRNPDFYEIIKQRPTAWVLLSLIAFRASRNGFGGYEIGEAAVGDYETYGVSRQVYRADLEWLKTNHLVTIKPTNKGTLVKLANSDFFDINPTATNQQNAKNQPTANQQPTTNNKENKENNKYNGSEELITYFNQLTGRKYKHVAGTTRDKKIKARLKEFSMEQLKQAVDNFVKWDWYQQNKDASWVTPEYLVRNYEQTEKFVMMKPVKVKKTGTELIQSLLEK